MSHAGHGVKTLSDPVCLNLDGPAHHRSAPPYSQPVGISRALGALLAAALLIPATPALAMTPRVQIPGWNPADAPFARAAFDEQLGDAVYAVTCRDVSATGWASSMRDDTTYDWRSMLVTTAAVSTACADTRADLIVRQEAETFPAYPFNVGSSTGLGSIAVIPYVTGVYWDLTPTPRVGQWVAIGARAADGTLLPILERRVSTVSSSMFTVDEAVGADYLGAPVVDNKMRVLGTLTSAGVEVTGSPVYCGVLFVCENPSRAWWDITAPSVARDVKATGGKGRVTVTWKVAAYDGGDAVTYSYSVNGGPWVKTTAFKVTVKALKGQRVTIAVGTVNYAGAGPTEIVSARAR